MRTGSVAEYAEDESAEERCEPPERRDRARAARERREMMGTMRPRAH